MTYSASDVARRPRLTAFAGLSLKELAKASASFLTGDTMRFQ